MSGLRITAMVAVCAVCGWGIWIVAASVRENTHAMPAVAKATPMKRPELRTDGVLTDAWLVRTLALRPNLSLAEVDLQALRTRLLGEPQVASATLTKHFPDRLIVQIAERSPLARVAVQWMGERHDLLVARDGVIYAGEGYEPSVLNTLPYISGVDIVPQRGGFRPIAGMAAAADLLARARLEAEHLYSTWFSISLARLQTDHRIDVTTTDGRVIYFSTTDDYFRQLAKLDTIYDALAARSPGAKATIDLTLGSDVPVTVVPLEPANPAPAGAPTPAPTNTASKRASAAAPRGFGFAEPATTRSESAFFILPSPQPRKIKREL